MTWERKMQFLRLMGNDKMSYFAGELDPRMFALKLWGDISQVDDGISFFGPDNGIVQTTLSDRMVEAMRQAISSTGDVQRVLLNLSMSLQQARGNQRNRQPNQLSVGEIGLVKDPNAPEPTPAAAPPHPPWVKKTAWMRALLTRFDKIEVPEAETETEDDELDDDY